MPLSEQYSYVWLHNVQKSGTEGMAHFGMVHIVTLDSAQSTGNFELFFRREREREILKFCTKKLVSLRGSPRPRSL